jgi:hypothetical protein
LKRPNGKQADGNGAGTNLEDISFVIVDANNVPQDAGGVFGAGKAILNSE